MTQNSNFELTWGFKKTEILKKNYHLGWHYKIQKIIVIELRKLTIIIIYEQTVVKEQKRKNNLYKKMNF